MTKGRPYTIALVNLNHPANRIVPEGWYVEQEAPMAIADDGLPEPDLKVDRGRAADYPSHPTTRDVAWIVEVSDSSLAEDQGEVLQTYAEQAIPIYWIVNIPGRCIQVYGDPTGPAVAPTYRSLATFQPGEVVPVVLDGREVGRIAVADVLPWSRRGGHPDRPNPRPPSRQYEACGLAASDSASSRDVGRSRRRSSRPLGNW